MIRASALALLAAGCVPAVVGEGDIDRETITLGAFDAVISDGIDVELQTGDEYAVILRSDENILPHLNAHRKGGTLLLSVEKDVLLYPTELVATVIAPDVQSVSIRDGADLVARDLSRDALAIEAIDDGDVTLSGDIALLQADISGKGEFDAQDLTAAEVDFTTDGSGDAWLTATDAVRITVLGPAQINVYGDPAEREVDASGSGEVLYY